MFRRRSLAALEADLAVVERAIAAHPFNSEETKAANAIVESYPAADRRDHLDAIERRLAEQGLPSSVELGKRTARHLTSWSRLHHRRYVLLKRIARANR